MTYIRTQDGQYKLVTEDGTFIGASLERVRLEATIAANDRALRRERAENFRQIALEEQRLALDFNESRRSGR